MIHGNVKRQRLLWSPVGGCVGGHSFRKRADGNSLSNFKWGVACHWVFPLLGRLPTDKPLRKGGAVKLRDLFKVDLWGRESAETPVQQIGHKDQEGGFQNEIWPEGRGFFLFVFFF